MATSRPTDKREAWERDPRLAKAREPLPTPVIIGIVAGVAGLILLISGLVWWGIGKKLIRAAVESAIQQNKKLLFALTTTANHLFSAMGFTPLSVDQLPDRKREKYDFAGSVIFGKFLN